MASDWKEEKMNVAIEKAKRRVEKSYGNLPGQRAWLEGHPPDSYEDEAYRVKLFVLEGSPCKGYIVADYGRMIVRPFECGGKALKTIYARDE